MIEVFELVKMSLSLPAYSGRFKDAATPHQSGTVAPSRRVECALKSQPGPASLTLSGHCLKDCANADGALAVGQEAHALLRVGITSKLAFSRSRWSDHFCIITRRSGKNAVRL
jgi:hypothetical protein